MDIEIIKKQHISQLMKDELMKLNQKNKERPKETLIFYTDGLLRRALGKEGSVVDQMGSGWVQLDEKEEKVLSESCFDTRNWPLSTKSELLAIWFVVLATPEQRKIKICTDSAAVIAGLKNKKEN